MACMCAETFAAECGCGNKAAEDAPIPSDPRVSPLTDGLHIPADSPALDLPRENAEIGGVDFKADSSPLPPDPRVSPLKKGLYTPSDTPEMAAEGNSYTNYQPLPEWPPAARHIITGLSKWERDESDKYRCGPVYLIDGEWSWCNGGSGDLGHIDGEMKWGFAEMVDIPEEEQENYPIETGDGYYTQRYDTENAKIYDVFLDAMVEMNKRAKADGPSKIQPQ